MAFLCATCGRVKSSLAFEYPNVHCNACSNKAARREVGQIHKELRQREKRVMKQELAALICPRRSFVKIIDEVFS